MDDILGKYKVYVHALMIFYILKKKKKDGENAILQVELGLSSEISTYMRYFWMMPLISILCVSGS